nr:MAG TPA: hypothetical protein [Caudoviricetes sp.]
MVKSGKRLVHWQTHLLLQATANPMRTFLPILIPSNVNGVHSTSLTCYLCKKKSKKSTQIICIFKNLLYLCIVQIPQVLYTYINRQ